MNLFSFLWVSFVVVAAARLRLELDPKSQNELVRQNRTQLISAKDKETKDDEIEHENEIEDKNEKENEDQNKDPSNIDPFGVKEGKVDKMFVGVLEKFGLAHGSTEEYSFVRDATLSDEDKPVMIFYATAAECPVFMFAHNKKYLPEGTELRYYSDDQMEVSVAQIAKEFADLTNVNGLNEAYHMLRPLAYRADLWRVLLLWSLPHDVPVFYADAKMLLTAPITDWIDIKNDKYVMPKDHLNSNRWWTGLMFNSQPKFGFWEKYAKSILQNIEGRVYPGGPSSVAGPGLPGGRAKFDFSEWSADRNTKVAFDGWGGGDNPSGDVPRNFRDEEIRNRGYAYYISLTDPNAICHGFVVSNGLSDGRATGCVIAVADFNLWHGGKSDHHHISYGDLYYDGQVYCDEPGPGSLTDDRCKINVLDPKLLLVEPMTAEEIAAATSLDSKEKEQKVRSQTFCFGDADNTPCWLAHAERSKKSKELVQKKWDGMSAKEREELVQNAKKSDAKKSDCELPSVLRI